MRECGLEGCIRVKCSTEKADFGPLSLLAGRHHSPTFRPASEHTSDEQQPPCHRTSPFSLRSSSSDPSHHQTSPLSVFEPRSDLLSNVARCGISMSESLDPASEPMIRLCGVVGQAR